MNLKTKIISLGVAMSVLVACGDNPTGGEETLSSESIINFSSSSDSVNTLDSLGQLDSLAFDSLVSSSLIHLSLSSLNSSSSGADTLGLSQTIQSSSSAFETPILEVSGNLKLDGNGLGSILNTKAFLAEATDGTAGTDDDELLNLKDRNGVSLGLKVGDHLTLSVRGQADVRFKVVATPAAPGVREIQTLSELIAEINTYLSANGTCALVNGQLQITGAGAGLDSFEINSDNSFSASKVATVFYFPNAVAAGDVEFSEELLRSARSTDLLKDLLDESGYNLGLELGDKISVDALLGGVALFNQTTHTYDPNWSSLQDVLDLIRDNLKLPLYHSGVEKYPSLSVNRAGTDDNLVDGSIVVRGMIGDDYKIKNLSTSATNSNSSIPAPYYFDANMSTTTLQSPKNTESFISTIAIPACGDKTIDLTVSYTWYNWNQFSYELSTQVVGVDIIQGKTGVIAFGVDGSFKLLGSDITQVKIDPSNMCNQTVEFNLEFDSLEGESGVDSELNYNWLSY